MSAAKQFEIIEPKVEFRYVENITTHTALVDPSDEKIKGTAEFIQCEDNKFLLAFEKPICAVGHTLEITVALTNIEARVRLNSRGKVLSVEKGDGFFNVELQLHNFDAGEFGRFIDKLGERQEQVAKLFDAVRGPLK